MKFGYFDDKNNEYVINTINTPTPWINYLGNQNFFSLISNTLGGYSFYKDAKLRRLTRYRYNDVPRDVSGRIYYIKDKNIIWNIGGIPVHTELDEYECHHGLGYTRVISSKNKLQADLLAFVPMNADCEINLLSLKNNSKETKKIDLYSFVEFCLYDTVGDATNFQRNLNVSEVEVDKNTIFHKTEYRERRNHYCFSYVNKEHDGFDTDLDTFLGLHNGLENPIVIQANKSTNSSFVGGSPIASHHHTLEIAPNQQLQIIYLLGYVENADNEKFVTKDIINKNKADELISRFNAPSKVLDAFQELKDYWSNLLCTFSIKTPSAEFNRMGNVWNQYQCMITYCMSRSASYYESGTGRGMGFRDSCQDLLGFVHLIPKRARERIIDIASIQFEDGSTYHQYQPLTKKGNADIGGGFNDDPLWLIAAVSAYIKETNDYSILDEKVPFNNVEGTEKSLYAHLLASINFTISHLGPHNLPLIGRADWNDCLNLNCFSTNPSDSFQTASNKDTGIAESVFIAGMFVKYGHELIDIANKINKKDDAEHISKAVEQVEKCTIEYGFEDNHFLRAYDSAGQKVGAYSCKEGKIFIEPQGFCTLARIGKKDNLGKKALIETEKYLANDYGIELLYPPYSTYHLELGEISSYPPGNKENGSVFCHNNPWITLAYCEEKEPEQAYKLYCKNAPAFIENISDIHKTEPYVYSQTIAGRSSRRYGEAKNSWLTGTASWSFVALSQGILGIKPTLDGLMIDPCLPKTFDKVEVKRIYQSKVYNITIDNEGRGKTTLIINNKAINGLTIPKDMPEDHVDVLVKM